MSIPASARRVVRRSRRMLSEDGPPMPAEVAPRSLRIEAPFEARLVSEQLSDGLGVPEGVQFHVLSFEGPDPYARIGGLETRVAGICEALAYSGHEAHLW